MSDEAYIGVSSEHLALIDELCSAFDTDLQSGHETRIENVISAAPAKIHRALLCELVATEVRIRQQQGQRPTTEEYVDRFPEFVNDIRRLISDEAEPVEVQSCPSLERRTVGWEKADHQRPEINLRESIERYEIGDEIARGGMGAVLKAHDQELNRKLAVKVLLSADVAPELRSRFVKEAQISGQLQHPGIVPVHDLGAMQDGRPFFSMKLVEGQTLAELLAARSDPDADRPRFLHWFKQICQTMAYAHAQGVIHRDLKPANVMIGAFGEVLVMDWGLAKQQDFADAVAVGSETGNETRPELTIDGTIFGTLRYMPPEQATGKVEAVDERSDVFSLGGILCEILTGTAPYPTGSGTVLLAQVQNADLTQCHETLAASNADSPLKQLAFACLTPDKQQRPASAAEISEKIVAYLDSVEQRRHEAELARKAAEVRAVEEGKRRRITLALAAASVLALCIFGGSWIWISSERSLRQQQTMEQAAIVNEQLRSGMKRVEDRREVAKTSSAADADSWVNVSQLSERVAELAKNPLADNELAADAAALHGHVQKRLHDHQLIASLEKIRIEQTAFDASGLRFDSRRSLGENCLLLAKFGLDPDTLATDEFVARIDQLTPNVGSALISYLDDALMIASDLKSPRTRFFAEAITRLDKDEVQKSLRKAYLDNDREALKSLSTKVDFANMSPAELLTIGRWLRAGNLRREAIDFLKRAYEANPGDYWINHQLAVLYEGNEPPQYEEAIRHHMTCVAVHENAGAWNNLGAVYHRHGDAEAAERHFARAVEVDRSLLLASLNLSMTLHSLGRIDEAIQVAKDLQAHSAENSGLWGVLGAIYAACEQGDTAVPYLQKYLDAVASDPVDSVSPIATTARMHLGRVLLGQGKVEQAGGYLKRAVETEPGWFHNQFHWARWLMETGELDRAAEHFALAIELDEHNADPHWKLGDIRQQQSRLDDAVKHFQKSLTIKADPDVLSTLGSVWIEQGQFEKGMSSYKQALELDADHYDANYNLGTMLMGASPHKAEPYLLKAISADPQNAEAHCNLAVALSNQGRMADALEFFKKGHALGIKNPDWQYPSATWIELATKDAKREQFIEAMTAETVLPDSLEELTALANLCRQKKHHARALRFYRAAITQQGLKNIHPTVLAPATESLFLAGTKDDITAEDRKTGLKWMQQTLALLEPAGSSFTSQEVREGSLMLVRALRESNAFGAVRNSAGLEGLPKEERTAWEKIWKDLDRLLKEIEI